ncbi:ribonuclease III [Thermodesulfovibrionales bacterium]|nr:ribonuclease III [Thermodesulfovibrionales bacterium]MCL0040134.1 ribonuclease III [Thermodesulfovibrionales bacterium]MCL0096170.1 ribonuclease III [Thermodesulfovibrionales bacterium]
MPVSFSENIEDIEKSIGYQFRDKDLLINALTHKSYHHENPDEAPYYNERLEFLGDSVLGLVIAETLFIDDKRLTEASMSKMKSYLVKGSLLFEIASRLSLGKYLRLGRGEESTGGRNKRSISADAVEALFGAVFLDSGYETIRSVILRLLRTKILSVISKEEGYDSKSELQERCQGIFGKLPEYRVVNQEGEEHKKIFTTEVYMNGRSYGRGTGGSKKSAQKAAAKEALQKLVNANK